MSNFKLLDYQEQAVEFMLNTEKCALWSPMGAGKTGMALTYLLELKKRQDAAMLVVCPLSVIQQWQSEIKKFTNFKKLRVCVLHGAAINYEYALFNLNIDIYLTNYESLSKMLGAIKFAKALKFNVIVFDESSKLKNGSTVRFKDAKKLVQLVPRIVHLSATPNPNSYMDLWAQYYLLDNGKRLCGFVTHFRSKYFNQAHNSFYVYKMKDNAADEITQAVADITYRITEDQIPQKPELFTHVVPFALSNSSIKRYKKLEKELFYVIDENEKESYDNVITANSITAKITKCRQFVSGFIIDHDTLITHEVHTDKLKILKDYIDTLNGEHVIIAYNYVKERNMLLQALPGARQLGSGMSQKEFNETVELWNDKQIPILICNPASVSHGLNLQAGGRHVVWYSLSYSYEGYVQLIGRLHRTGQQSSVHNHILLANDTLDKVIYERLQLKDQSQQAFFELLLSYKSKN